jgi:hypothetical protein
MPVWRVRIRSILHPHRRHLPRISMADMQPSPTMQARSCVRRNGGPSVRGALQQHSRVVHLRYTHEIRAYFPASVRGRETAVSLVFVLANDFFA